MMQEVKYDKALNKHATTMMTMMQNKIKQTPQACKHGHNTTIMEVLVLGHHNTPPLREDLVPRSRMAPEGKRKRKRRGKTKLLL